MGSVIKQRIIRTCIVPVGLVMVLSACQDAIGIGVANTCDKTIEVRAGTVPLEDETTSWYRIEPGGAEEVIGVPTRTENDLILGIRSDVGSAVRIYILEIGDLPQAPAGLDYDLEVVIGGSDCAPTEPQIMATRMTDVRWPASDGWVKMAQHVNGVDIHYVWNTVSGAVGDFKFVGAP